MRADLLRSELQQLLRQAPFRPFVITLESGQRALIEHPENMAFDPKPGGPGDFYVRTGGLRLYSTFEAVSSVTMLANGTGEQAGEQEQVKA